MQGAGCRVQGAGFDREGEGPARRRGALPVRELWVDAYAHAAAVQAAGHLRER